MIEERPPIKETYPKPPQAASRQMSDKKSKKAPLSQYDLLKQIMAREEVAGFFGKYKRIAKPSPHEDPCLITDKVGNKEGGKGYAIIGQQFGENPKPGIGLHNYAYFFEDATTVEERLEQAKKNPKHQVSHLCGNSKCIKRSHLCFESPTDNNSRKNCRRGYKCAKCGHVMMTCTHEPKCTHFGDGTCAKCL